MYSIYTTHLMKNVVPVWSTLGPVAHTSDDTGILLQGSELCSKPDESM